MVEGGNVLSWLRRNVPGFYLLRFPIILALILLALVPLGLVWIPTMFRNLFILQAPGVVLVALFATLGAMTVLVTGRITLLYGPQRFGVDWPRRNPHLGFRTIAAHLLVIAPLIGAVVWLSATEGELGLLPAAVMALLGLIAGGIVVWSAEFVQAWMTSADVARPDMAVPSRRAIVAAHRRSPPAMPRLLRRVLVWFRPVLGPGYLAPNGDLLPGHTFATAFLFVYAGVYLLGYFLWHPGTNAGANVPALASLLIVATLSIWLLAGLAFFCDRHRVPILLPVLVTSMILWTTSHSDYYFDLVRPTGDWSLLEDPADIARKRQHELLTVVAVDGGGIQAAAWGARVLTGIQGAWPDFYRSVRFISSVSGGSVGTMLLRRRVACRGAANAEGARRGADVRGAGEPERGSVGICVSRSLARHRANPASLGLREGSWVGRATGMGARVEGEPGMGQNAEFIRMGQGRARRVAAIDLFQCCRRREWSAVFFWNVAPPYQWGIDTVNTTFPDFDVPVSTAARLSATFPYVTPIARSRPGPGVPNGWHFADGGYYDNTGMGLAMRWLDHALGARVDRTGGRPLRSFASAPHRRSCNPTPRIAAGSIRSLDPCRP